MLCLNCSASNLGGSTEWLTTWTNICSTRTRLIWNFTIVLELLVLLYYYNVRCIQLIFLSSLFRTEVVVVVVAHVTEAVRRNKTSIWHLFCYSSAKNYYRCDVAGDTATSTITPYAETCKTWYTDPTKVTIEQWALIKHCLWATKMVTHSKSVDPLYVLHKKCNCRSLKNMFLIKIKVLTF
jgi:hypothetical protein